MSIEPETQNIVVEEPAQIISAEESLADEQATPEEQKEALAPQKEKVPVFRELRKDSNNFYTLVIIDAENKKRTEKGYSKQELKETHDNLVNELADCTRSIKALKKAVDDAKVADTPELREWIKKFQSMQDLASKEENESRLAQAEKYEAKLLSEKKEIEMAVPEVLRNA